MMKYERVVRTMAVGERLFDNRSPKAGLDGRGKVICMRWSRRRGRFAIEEARRWVEMRDGWASFGGRVPDSRHPQHGNGDLSCRVEAAGSGLPPPARGKKQGVE